MAEKRLLHVICLTLESCAQITQVLRRSRLAHERAKNGGTLLLFCDLPNAPSEKTPQDEELIRCVQSGVMSMAARRPGQYLFLVRGRSLNGAARAYLGREQAIGVRRVLYALLAGGEDRPRFEAANFFPASLEGAYDAVLIQDAALCAPPDTPARLLGQLAATGESALRAGVVFPRQALEPLFARLERAGFSLLPPLLLRGAHATEPPAAIYTIPALLGNAPAVQAEECVFVRETPPSLSEHLHRAAVSYARRTDKRPLLPLAQLGLLFVSAWLGLPLLAALCILVPEINALAHPRRLPAALVRLALLPRHSVIALDALLRRRFADQSVHLSILTGPGAGIVCGGALFFLALRSAQALTPLLAVSLLWLSAPLMEQALALPARERIPLDEGEQTQLRALVTASFAALSPDAASPAHMLSACGGCMLGLLEPDEAARRMEGMLGRLELATPFDHACLLAAAQYIASRMGECDAALRELPSRLIALQEAQPLSKTGSLLGALLAIAKENIPAPRALARLKTAVPGDALDALFLPGEAVAAGESLLPITHPHTFLQRLSEDAFRKEKSDPPLPTEEANRFLILVSALLSMPFAPLLAQSSPVAPYMPLLNQV